jgi:hypothetical protein
MSMALVTGIGGFFFRTRNPEAIARWYHENLDVTPPAATYDEPPWRQEAGSTVFHGFPHDTKSFGNPDKQRIAALPCPGAGCRTRLKHVRPLPVQQERAVPLLDRVVVHPERVVHSLTSPTTSGPSMMANWVSRTSEG